MNDRTRLIAAFLAGQAVMLGLACLLRPTPAAARADGESVTADSIFVRKSATSAGIQMVAAGASGGPGLTFFDASGASRMQMSLDANGKPTVILRGKAGDVAIGIGLQGEDQATIAVRNVKGGLVTVPLPDK